MKRCCSPAQDRNGLSPSRPPVRVAIWRVGRCALSCIGLSLALGPAILAQNADLSGRVLDQSHLGVPGATVVIAERRTSIERSAQTNGSGLYSLPDLPP